MQFFQIIRWKNLLMLAYMLVLVKYILLPLFKISGILTSIQFFALVLASLLIAAGGYVVNDLFDVEIDKINKPSKIWIPTYLNRRQAWMLYAILNSAGMLLGLFVCIATENLIGTVLFILPVVLLFLYAGLLKKVLFIGNLLVSSLIVFGLILLVYLENIPLSFDDFGFLSITSVLLSLGFFSFAINLIREIVKDAEDNEGDIVHEVVSIPIKFGMKATKGILWVITIVVFVTITLLSVLVFKVQPRLSLYLAFVVLGSFIFFLKRLHKATSSADFAQLSTYLKVIMLLGMLAVLLIKPI